MLAFFTSETRGFSDRLLVQVASDLRARGVRLSGAVQVNIERPGHRHCDMQLQILTGAGNVTISQRLGDGARGCRLDPGGLERAVGLVEAELDSGADVLILNKFGKQEAEGRGFRPLIGEALARDIPVLTAVAASNRAAFLEFCDGIATELPADAERLADWAVGSLGRRLALEEGDQVGPIPG